MAANLNAARLGDPKARRALCDWCMVSAYYLASLLLPPSECISLIGNTVETFLLAKDRRKFGGAFLSTIKQRLTSRLAHAGRLPIGLNYSPRSQHPAVSAKGQLLAPGTLAKRQGRVVTLETQISGVAAYNRSTCAATLHMPSVS